MTDGKQVSLGVGQEMGSVGRGDVEQGGVAEFWNDTKICKWKIR